MSSACSDRRPDLDPAGRRIALADAELASLGFSRRGMLRAGALAAAGAGLGASALAAPGRADAAPARPVRPKHLTWLVGDHHVHTVFSHDAKYRIQDQLDAAQRFGVDWLAFTEHANFAHADRGLADSGDLLDAERARRDLLIFQGLEWYIPAAEHGSVILAPGKDSRDILRAFELTFDGKLNGWEKPADAAQHAEWEARAAAAIAWLGQQKREGRIEDALVLANHPMRLGIDSPHEMRRWRDADPDIMVGMEGAPGAQGSGVSTFARAGDQRGEYTNAPRPDSFAAYPVEAYRPWGGFDWMTATVGGMWDAMLAEGLPFWITANSDHHLQVRDTRRIGDYPAEEPYLSLDSEFDRWAVRGRRPDPVEAGEPQGGSDYWPGEFARIHTGVTDRSYAAVMDAIRGGRMWVDHGHLLDGFEVSVQGLSTGRGRERTTGPEATLGGRLGVRRGQDVQVTLRITTCDTENSAGILPHLDHVDLIAGPITGPVADADEMRAPATRVVRQIDTAGRRGTFTLTHVFEDVQEDFYVRFRGSDGNRLGAGYHGAEVDPAGPQRHGDRLGDADPWTDTWFYANPVFVDVR